MSTARQKDVFVEVSDVTFLSNEVHITELLFSAIAVGFLKLFQCLKLNITSVLVEIGIT